MLKARFSPDEREWLVRLAEPDQIACETISPRIFECAMREEVAETLRERCGIELQRWGFDADAKLTEAGRVLESLIDKLFIE